MLWRTSTAARTTSDGGAVLLRETDRRLNLLPRMAACFENRRFPTTHSNARWRALPKAPLNKFAAVPPLRESFL
jgi:hypothetical protein